MIVTTAGPQRRIVLRRAAFVMAVLALLFAAAGLRAQNTPAPLPPPPPGYTLIPAPSGLTLSPATLKLLELEGQMQGAVDRDGGKAFASWFAEDGVILADGQPPVTGRININLTAAWDPKSYQLAWTAEGAQMGPSGDMGYTWGRVVSRTVPPGGGDPVLAAKRYITVWKKTSDGWKIALESSGQEAK